ncbi:hypothetical protein TRVA0_012S01574 [Trichomonascus vanleenenianus]|uniref:GTPase-activating protein RGS2 n=1 Tax=Trichomonascus vanleenenianus TaxID=2268995 RepID=UPI003EC9723D
MNIRRMSVAAIYPHETALPQPRANAPGSYSASSLLAQSRTPPPESFQYHAKIPTLHEIVTDRAPAPYSLHSFAAFLRHNHCSELLEFAVDVYRYQQAYYGWNDSVATSACTSTTLLNSAWNRLMDLYIEADSHREINIPAVIRSRLLSIETSALAPIHPTHLEPALNAVMDLMKENAYLTFVTTASSPSCSSEALSSRSVSPIQPLPPLVRTGYDEHGRHAKKQHVEEKNDLHAVAPFLTDSSSTSSTEEECFNHSADLRRAKTGVVRGASSPKKQFTHWRKMSSKLKWLGSK